MQEVEGFLSGERDYTKMKGRQIPHYYKENPLVKVILDRLCILQDSCIFSVPYFTLRILA